MQCAFDYGAPRVVPGSPLDIGKGPTALRKQWAIDTTANIQNPPFSARKNQNTLNSVMVRWWIEDTPGPPRSQDKKMEWHKIGSPFPSKQIKGVTRDSSGNPLGFCKVEIFRTSDNDRRSSGPTKSPFENSQSRSRRREEADHFLEFRAPIRLLTSAATLFKQALKAEFQMPCHSSARGSVRTGPPS